MSPSFAAEQTDGIAKDWRWNRMASSIVKFPWLSAVAIGLVIRHLGSADARSMLCSDEEAGQNLPSL